MTDVFDDLMAEYEQLEAVLAALSGEQWSHPSAAPGWTVSDVVLHLTQGDEAVVRSIAGERTPLDDVPTGRMDAIADELVAAHGGSAPDELLARWRAAASATAAALRAVPQGTRLTWVVGQLSAATLATTRLAEHWAHAGDITEPLGILYPDTSRLRHTAWLGHRTLPYAFGVEGLDGGPVRCELTAPDGSLWQFGDPDAPSTVTGPAADFCRVGARRLAVADSALRATGPHGPQALAVLRNYAF